MDFIIRPIRQEDADAITRIRLMPAITENTLAMPSEREERMRGMIQNSDDNLHSFVAETVGENPRVIGMAGLNVYTGRRRHVGGVGIIVHPDCHGQGVGRALMEKLLDVADNWLMLVRVELEVLCGNPGAIHLYEKLGFEREGVRRCGSIRKGEYADELMMARIRRA